jgi:hypothetical protein
MYWRVILEVKMSGVYVCGVENIDDDSDFGLV